MNIVDHLLGNYLSKSEKAQKAARSCDSGDRVYNYLSACIEQIKNNTNLLQDNSTYSFDGRVGPKLVPTPTTITLQNTILNRHIVTFGESFPTILANVGVSKGKWMFEVVIGSPGDINIGWSVHNPIQPFSNKVGVGETLHSYSYDGRKKCWNFYSKEYGQHWAMGDIISSYIDLEARTISYARNGENLGVAFQDIETGPKLDVAIPGILYVPTLSLAASEYVVINYGSTPFVHPYQGFQPLQPPPNISTAATGLQLLRSILVTSEEKLEFNPLKSVPCQLFNIARIKHQLYKKILDVMVCPTLRDHSISSYFSRGCLSDFMQTLIGEDFMRDNTILTSEERSKVTPLMDFLSLINIHLSDKRTIFEDLLKSWVVMVSQTCRDLEFLTTKRVLRLAIAFFSHPSTRRFCLTNLLFHKDCDSLLVNLFKFQIDEALMKSTVTHEFNSHPNEEEKKKITFATHEVEMLHVSLLQILLSVEPDQLPNESSRVIFLQKMKKESLHYNFLPNGDSGRVFQSFFKAMMLCIDGLWQNEGKAMCQVFTPVKYFFSSETFFIEITRVSGDWNVIDSHLNKQVNNYLQQITGLHEDTTDEIDYDLLREATSDWNELSLYGLTDALVHFYRLCVHINFVNDGISKEHYLKVLEQYNELRELCHGLMNTNTILENNLNKLKVKCQKLYVSNVWSDLLNFSGRKASCLVNLMDYVANTLTNCSSRHLVFFPFVPDYYIETLTGLITGLFVRFHLPENARRIHCSSFLTATTFIGRYFLKDWMHSQKNVIRCMESLVSNLSTLELMHSLDTETRQLFVRSLLSSSYDEYNWRRCSSILGRFWSEDGFGFKYTFIPHLIYKRTHKPSFTSKGLQWKKPVSSKVFQEDIRSFFVSNISCAQSFLTRVITKLNKSFTEFFKIFLKIYNFSKSGRVFKDSSKLNICRKCFDLSVALLRVMEMVLTLYPDVILTKDIAHAEHAELLLTMTCKTLCSVLFRVSVLGFSTIVSLDMPGMDDVHHYPVVTASVGVLLALLRSDLDNRDKENHTPVVTNMIISKAGFNMTTLDKLFIAKDDQEVGQNSDNPDNKSCWPFSLRDYPSDVTGEELTKLQECVSYLKDYQRLKESSPTESERENECVICYEREATTIMMPCQHTACRVCIKEQLLCRNDCFFCRSVIEFIR